MTSLSPTLKYHLPSYYYRTWPSHKYGEHSEPTKTKYKWWHSLIPRALEELIQSQKSEGEWDWGKDGEKGERSSNSNRPRLLSFPRDLPLTPRQPWAACTGGCLFTRYLQSHLERTAQSVDYTRSESWNHLRYREMSSWGCREVTFPFYFWFWIGKRIIESQRKKLIAPGIQPAK